MPVQKKAGNLLNTPCISYDPKDSDKTGYGAVYKSKTSKKCLPKETSVFTAETRVIQLTLNIVSISNSKRFIPLSDSLFIMSSIKIQTVNNPLITNPLTSLTSITLIKKKCYSAGPRIIQESKKTIKLTQLPNLLSTWQKNPPKYHTPL